MSTSSREPHATTAPYARSHPRSETPGTLHPVPKLSDAAPVAAKPKRARAPKAKK